MSQRIGFLGGTFDPIHKGHLAMARFVLNELALDELQLIPNHVPPHKAGPNVSARDRLTMAQLAVQGEPKITVNALELEHDQPSFTIYTLERLRASLSDASLFFVMGMDSFANLSSWHKWDELLHHVNLVVCQRPGDEFPHKGKEARLWQQHQAPAETVLPLGQIIRLKNPLWPIASSQIREELSQGADASEWLTSGVIEYLHKNNLYKE